MFNLFFVTTRSFSSIILFGIIALCKFSEFSLNLFYDENRFFSFFEKKLEMNVLEEKNGCFIFLMIEQPF
jgi:hypothetical protein